MTAYVGGCQGSAEWRALVTAEESEKLYRERTYALVRAWKNTADKHGCYTEK
jgi:hypothetical protein